MRIQINFTIQISFNILYNQKVSTTNDPCSRMSKRTKLKDIEDISTHLRQFSVIKEWRRGVIADVDVYGCEQLAEPGVDDKVST